MWGGSLLFLGGCELCLEGLDGMDVCDWGRMDVCGHSVWRIGNAGGKARSHGHAVGRGM